MLQIDRRIPGREIWLRPSQVKFESESTTLNVIRCSKFSQGYLNRQVIILLHCIGVPIEYFLEAQ